MKRLPVDLEARRGSETKRHRVGERITQRHLCDYGNEFGTAAGRAGLAMDRFNRSISSLYLVTLQNQCLRDRLRLTYPGLDVTEEELREVAVGIFDRLFRLPMP